MPDTSTPATRHPWDTNWSAENRLNAWSLFPRATGNTLTAFPSMKEADTALRSGTCRYNRFRELLVSGDPLIEASRMGHRNEHAIEVHLPFIQEVLGEVNILPIVMGEQRREYCFHHHD